MGITSSNDDSDGVHPGRTTRDERRIVSSDARTNSVRVHPRSSETDDRAFNLRLWLTRNWHRVLVHAICITALVLLGYYYFFGDLATPVRFVMLRTGTIGLILLVASFSCTPLARVLHWQGAIQIRRALGLYGFLFIALHLFAYAYGDNEFDLELILRDLGERYSMFVGTLAFVLLIPLALTSTRGWQRRLGRRWKVLHRLIYIAMPLAVLHYLWLDRDLIQLPLLYAAAVVVLLLLRLIPYLAKAGKS